MPLVVAGALTAQAAGPTNAAPAQSASGGAPGATVAQRAPERLSARATRHALTGHRVAVTGASTPAAPNRPIVVEERRGASWHAVAHARTNSNGRFRTAWRAGALGTHRLRVRDAGSGAPAADAGRVVVYREVFASYYGPGLYGGALACGGTLDPGTIGVASKTLPCGSRVKLRYHGRSVNVPVIDRGPYVAGRTYDLTSATKDRLGFPSTGVVWSAR